MGQVRTSIFADDKGLDVSRFTPEPAAEAGPTEADIDAAVKGSKFRTREIQPTLAESAVPPKRKPRTYRTGRTQNFTCKTTPAAFESLYAIAEAQNWKIGEAFEEAVDALKARLKGQVT